MADKETTIEKLFNDYLLKAERFTISGEHTSSKYCLHFSSPKLQHHIHFYENKFYLIVEPNYEIHVLDEKYTEKFRFLLIMAGVKV